jgi:hypothetical protein
MSARHEESRRGRDREQASGPADEREQTADAAAGQGPWSSSLNDEELTWIAGGLETQPSEEEPWNPGNYPMA